MDGKIPARSHSVFSFRPVCFHLWDSVSVFAETREGIFRPFLWDPLLMPDEPYLFGFHPVFSLCVIHVTIIYYVNTSTNHQICILTC